MPQTGDTAVSNSPRFSYEVHLSWVLKNNGFADARLLDVNTPLDNPLQFEDVNKGQPKHLVLHTIISCFMTTYLFFAKKMNFRILHFECSAVANMDAMEFGNPIQHVHLYPKIFIAEESLRAKAEMAIEKTRKYCLAANADGIIPECHCTILAEKLPVLETTEVVRFRPSHSRAYAEEVGDKLGIDFKKISLHEFRIGLDVEMEHGTINKETNITDNNILLTAKIAWVHLIEIPDYYTRLVKMEREAKYK